MNNRTSMAMGIPLRRRLLAAALMTMVAAAAMEPAYSQNKEAPRNYAIQAGDLGNALDQLASQAGMQIVYPGDLVRGKRAVAISGELTLQDALQKVLAGTGLTWGTVNGNTIVIRRAEAPSRPAKQSPAQSQAGIAQGEEAVELEKMIVTGSRIRRAEIEGPSPVIFLTRQDLARTGRSTVGDALATLPQNFAPPAQFEGTLYNPSQVDLRGLGADNTLVLVNGRRLANSGLGSSWFTSIVDLNSIPLSAVERIEVLTDGASAVYGSDAVAGVVNVILKKDYRGMEISANYGVSSEGGASERRVGFAIGGASGQARALLTGEYFSRGRLSPTDREFSRGANQTDHGGRDFRTTFPNPGNVFSLNGQNLPGLNAPFAGIPRGQDGHDLTPGDLAPTAGLLNYDEFNYTDLVAAAERWSLNGRFDWELGSGLALFAEVGASHSISESRLSPPRLSVVVPASNPFNPFGQSVRVQWMAAEYGPRLAENEADNLRAVLGLNGRIAEDWAWETSLVYSQDEADAPGDPFPQSSVITALLSRTDPSVALNVFGDGEGANSPAVMEELIRGSYRFPAQGKGDNLSWSGQMDGVLARWSGRELRAATGAEFRREGFERTILEAVPNAPPRVSSSTTGDRDVKAVFAELSLPLFDAENKRSGFHALELQLAGRWDHYSDFGNTFNPRAAVRWQPLASLALRASAGTGFRAPALQELFGPVFVSPNIPIIDPRRNNESTLITLTQGGNSDLGPEESESWNVGLVWDIPGTQGLSLSLDRYHLRQDRQVNRGTFLRSQISGELEALFPERYRRAEPTPEEAAAGLPGRLLAIDARFLNVSDVTFRGIDVGLHYSKAVTAGSFDFRLNGSYIDRIEVRLTPLAPVKQVEGTTDLGLAGTGSPVRFRGNTSLFWNRSAWELGITERYTSALRETNAASPLFGKRYDDHFETDVQASYRWQAQNGLLAGMRASLGIENLFNTEPPFVDNTYGYLGSVYSPRQRFFYLTLTKEF